MQSENYQSFLPPAVMVHGLEQARRACALGLPVTLLSAPGAAAAWGCLWWQSLLAAVPYAGPALLDCGTAPGRATEALTLGVKGVILASCPVWDELAWLATQTQAVLLPASPAFLDLGQNDRWRKQDETRLLAWLGG